MNRRDARSTIDWPALARLRAAFLAGTAGQRDYWHSESDLESYDHTFAQRIRWKWDYVLADLRRRGWSPPAGAVLDFGCGTGIASRSFLTHLGTQALSTLYLSDRSTLAMQFAGQRIREEFPGTPVWLETSPPPRVDVLLLSHMLTEMPNPLVSDATVIIWVEPGTYECSRKLIEFREKLRRDYHIVAPCTHREACGMLTAENSRHWCHHFAPSPPEVFTDGNWARFAKLAGIDLRSLPVSYLVLDRRPIEYGGVRAIGRPRVYKAHALVLQCDATGVRDHRITKRDDPEEFWRLKKGKPTP